MAALDAETGVLSYVNAGHNPPLLIRSDGNVEKLQDGGMVLGIFESVPYADGLVELRRGDTLLVFSDGVTETWNPEGDEFGEQGLMRARHPRARAGRGEPAGRDPPRARPFRGGRQGHRRPDPDRPEAVLTTPRLDRRP